VKKIILLSGLVIIALLSLQIVSFAQCGDDPIDPAIEVPFEVLVKAIPDVVYLSVVNGNTPVPNACGLNPKNDPNEWFGWGGPLDHDNMSIGEGIGQHNLITVGKVRYERGIGTHATATFIFDLTGKEYKSFHAVVGPDAEKYFGDNFQCGTGGSVQYDFSIDGNQVYESAVLKGSDITDKGEGELVEFDIPNGAKELQIDILDGGDGIGCDHADIADAYLVPAGMTPVTPKAKLSVTWGELKL